MILPTKSPQSVSYVAPPPRAYEVAYARFFTMLENVSLPGDFVRVVS